MSRKFSFLIVVTLLAFSTEILIPVIHSLAHKNSTTHSHSTSVKDTSFTRLHHLLANENEEVEEKGEFDHQSSVLIDFKVLISRMLNQQEHASAQARNSVDPIPATQVLTRICKFQI